MWKRIRIKTEFENRLARLPVIRFSGDARQQKLGFSFGSIAFYRDHNCRSNQYSVLLFLGDDDAALFDSETLAQSGRHNDCAALAHFGGFQREASPEYLKVGLCKMPEYQPSGRKGCLLDCCIP